MQRILVALALLVPVASLSSLSAVSQARLFLRSHVAKPPQGDELAELNRENPEAYALVKALLTKRSLGLLNPRHPTASFAAPAAEPDASEQGPEVFAKFASPGELEAHGVHPDAPAADVPYANVQTSHKDWLNWKPQEGGMSDEQMVQNVLGAVAQLKGGKKSGLLSKQRSSESAFAADESSFGVEAAPAAPAQPAVAPPAPRENSYLKTVDFGVGTPEALPAEKPAAPAKHENSYLAGLDLSGDMPKVVASEKKQTSQVQHSSNNYLASFSWDDSKPAQQAPPKEVEEVEVKSNGHDGTLLSWLGVVHKKAAPKVVAAAAPSNPYLMDLS